VTAGYNNSNLSPPAARHTSKAVNRIHQPVDCLSLLDVSLDAQKEWSSHDLYEAQTITAARLIVQVKAYLNPQQGGSVRDGMSQRK